MIRTIVFVLSLVTVTVTGCAQESALIADGAGLVLVSDDFEFTEGPATAPNGDVYFTDQPNNRILRWDARSGEVDTFMEPAGRANGLYWDYSGNLLAAADERFALWRISRDGDVEVLADAFEGKHFNGPNDIWVHPDGTIYFTDPYYQRPWWERQEMEIEAQQVYLLRPGATAPELAASGLVQPNGIIGTADGRTLYVADIGDSKTYRYDIREDGSLGERILVTGMGSDGMTLDERGNIYLTGKGVHIFSPEGAQLAHIEVPESWTANVTFGGTDGKTLFITAMDSVYTLRMAVAGMHQKAL